MNLLIAALVLVGYQGWFRCPGDGSPLNRWAHWSQGAPTAMNISVDMFPDTTDLSPRSRCAVPGMTIRGRQAWLFSSFPKEIAEKHFEWMRRYGIDGALIQRFIADLPALHSENDAVLGNIRAAAEGNHRVFALEYDLSGRTDRASLEALRQDWMSLKITASPAYLKIRGKPLVSLWGIGFGDNAHGADPAAIGELIRWFHTAGGATVMGGVPAGWRTLNADSSADSAWSAVYAELDIVQPWTVGRYTTIDAADRWEADHLIPDLAETSRHGQLYMPVIFPGFSWHNLNRDQPENQIPRRAGSFLMAQARNARAAGADLLKIAMFDEVNEGTAIFKTAATHAEAPDVGYWLTLDADGSKLPSDFYLRLAGRITQMFHHPPALRP